MPGQIWPRTFQECVTVTVSNIENGSITERNWSIIGTNNNNRYISNQSKSNAVQYKIKCNNYK